MSRTLLWAGVVFATLGGTARAQEIPFPGESVTPVGFHDHSRVAPLFRHRQAPCYPAYPDCPPGFPGMPVTPGTPVDPTAPPVAPPDMSGLTTPFATGTEGGGLQGRAFNEAFDGDFATVFYRKTVFSTTFVRRQVGTRQIVRFRPNPEGPPTRVVINVPVFGMVPVTTGQAVLVPVPGRYSGISITDNDSPRPTDRIYFHYSYYDGIGSQMNPGLGNITMNRPMIGFEKTFLGGDASVGLRLPFIQLNGPPGVGADVVGDLSILTKYAFVNEPDSVLSAGLIVTTPTGPRGGFLSDGTEVPHSVLFQPWGGFVRVFDRAYVQGITALVAPTDGRDTTLWANSLGLGYWLYRADADRLVRGIIPVAEVHVRTPFNNRDPGGMIYLQDQVNLTGGLHVRFPRATLGGAVCVPVVAPRPWNVEAIANFTYWF